MLIFTLLFVHYYRFRLDYCLPTWKRMKDGSSVEATQGLPAKGLRQVLPHLHLDLHTPVLTGEK
jgi:hypothetical protein